MSSIRRIDYYLLGNYLNKVHFEFYKIAHPLFSTLE